MKIKKIIGLVLSCCMITGMFAGCIGNVPEKKEENSSEAVSDSSAESGEIDYNASFDLRLMSSLTGEVRVGLMDEAIEIFHEKWPNVNIINETTADFAQKFKLSFSSGTGYEIVYLDDLNQQVLMEGNYLMDITEDVKERGWLDKTVSGAVEFNNLRTPGKYYSTAFLMAPVVVYYNKDIFNELNLEIPETVEEVEAVMAAVKEAGYIPTECGGDFYHQILWAVEAMVLNSAPKDEVDDWYYGKACSDNVKNAFIEAYTCIMDWYEKGYFRENFEGTKMDDVYTLFSQGQTAFVLAGDWDLSNYNNTGLNLGTFAFPGFEAGGQYMVNATDGAWALNADLNATEKEAALDFIDIFYQDEYVKKWYEGGFTIATQTDISDVETSELQKEIVACTKDTKIGFFLDNVKSGYLDFMVKETQLLTQGEHTPETLWESLYAEWNKK